MTKTPHKHAALIKAWADGAEIEYWAEIERQWKHNSIPTWTGRKYRIKPETISIPMPRPVWVNIVDTHELKVAFATQDECSQAFIALENIEK